MRKTWAPANHPALPQTYNDLVRLTELAAHFGGEDFCTNKCPHIYKKDYDTNILREYYHSTVTERSEARCCSGCASHSGYFMLSVPKERSHFERMKKEYNFDSIKGFNNKGCVLPRDQRSVTCLRYYCGIYQQHADVPLSILQLINMVNIYDRGNANE